MPARTTSRTKPSSRRPTKRERTHDAPIKRGQPISRRQSWTQTLAKAHEDDGPVSRQGSISPKLEDVIVQRQALSAPAAPLVTSTYNTKVLAGMMTTLLVCLTAGAGWYIWLHRQQLGLATVATEPVVPHHLTVTPQPASTSALPLELPVASQSSSPATASTSAKVQPLYRASLEQESLPQLSEQLGVAITNLSSQHIRTDTVSHLQKLGQAAEQADDTTTAKNDYMDALEMAHELQAVYNYYHHQ